MRQVVRGRNCAVPDFLVHMLHVTSDPFTDRSAHFIAAEETKILEVACFKCHGMYVIGQQLKPNLCHQLKNT